MKSRLIKIVTFLGGIYFFLEFLLPKYIFLGDTVIQIGRHKSVMLRCVQVMGAMAFGLGIINLVRIHGYAVVRKRKDWSYSLVLLIGMFGTSSVTDADTVGCEVVLPGSEGRTRRWVSRGLFRSFSRLSRTRRLAGGRSGRLDGRRGSSAHVAVRPTARGSRRGGSSSVVAAGTSAP